MGTRKFATIQHWINPAINPTYEVRFKFDSATYSMIGQVLFFDMDGRAAVAGGDSSYVGVYDDRGGYLKGLLRLEFIESITPEEREET